MDCINVTMGGPIVLQGFLTVIMHDGVQGLEFLHEGNWIPVPAVQHGLVINGGDYLSLLSHGRYHSPVHRVLCPPLGSRRTSFVLFFYPAFNSTIPTAISAGTDGAQSARGSITGLSYNTLLPELQRGDESLVVSSGGEIESGLTGEGLVGTVEGSVDDDSSSAHSPSFGDYIMMKWQGVLAATP